MSLGDGKRIHVTPGHIRLAEDRNSLLITLED
jgi:hypothetical protein